MTILELKVTTHRQRKTSGNREAEPATGRARRGGWRPIPRRKYRFHVGWRDAGPGVLHREFNALRMHANA